MTGCAVRVEDSIDLGDCLTRAIALNGITHKECWLTCEIDGASWSRMLRGQQPMDLWKLRRLPRPVLRDFFANIAAAFIRFWWDEAIPLRMEKSDLRDERKERAS